MIVLFVCACLVELDRLNWTEVCEHPTSPDPGEEKRTEGGKRGGEKKGGEEGRREGEREGEREGRGEREKRRDNCQLENAPTVYYDCFTLA